MIVSVFTFFTFFKFIGSRFISNLTRFTDAYALFKYNSNNITVFNFKENWVGLLS